MKQNQYNKKQTNKNGKDIYIPNGGDATKDGTKLLKRDPVA